MIPSGLISMSSASTGCSNASAASFENDSVERPWKERAQSTCFSSGERVGGGSSRPSVRERSAGSVELLGWDAEGAGDRGLLFPVGSC